MGMFTEQVTTNIFKIYIIIHKWKNKLGNLQEMFTGYNSDNLAYYE